MKIAIFDEELLSSDNFKFMPHFARDDSYVINGTQICSNGQFNIKFVNFKSNDFQIRNQISS